MQSSEQQSQPQASSDETGEAPFEQQETPPLYAFASQADTTALQSETTAAADAQQSEEAPLDPLALALAVREGRIYPPPPSYYENLVSIPNGQVGLSSATINSARPAPPSYPPPVYAPPPYQTPRAVKPRRPRVWVWIVVVALGVGLVGCGLLSWAIYPISSTAYQSASGSIQVIDDFYSNLQSQNYAAAYHDLDMPNLTLAQFTRQAQQADQAGPIQSYTLQQPSFSTNQNGPDLSHLSYTINVTRAHASYTALIDASQEGNSWKITYFDRL
jgi:hypothetical protein